MIDFCFFGTLLLYKTAARYSVQLRSSGVENFFEKSYRGQLYIKMQCRIYRIFVLNRILCIAFIKFYIKFSKKLFYMSKSKLFKDKRQIKLQKNFERIIWNLHRKQRQKKKYISKNISSWFAGLLLDPQFEMPKSIQTDFPRLEKVKKIFYKIFAEFWFCAEIRHIRGKSLFCWRIELWIFYQTVYKHTKMFLYPISSYLLWMVFLIKLFLD